MANTTPEFCYDYLFRSLERVGLSDTVVDIPLLLSASVPSTQFVEQLRITIGDDKFRELKRVMKNRSILMDLDTAIRAIKPPSAQLPLQSFLDSSTSARGLSEFQYHLPRKTVDDLVGRVIKNDRRGFALRVIDVQTHDDSVVIHLYQDTSIHVYNNRTTADLKSWVSITFVDFLQELQQSRTTQQVRFRDTNSHASPLFNRDMQVQYETELNTNLHFGIVGWGSHKYRFLLRDLSTGEKFYLDISFGRDLAVTAVQLFLVPAGDDVVKSDSFRLESLMSVSAMKPIITEVPLSELGVTNSGENLDDSKTRLLQEIHSLSDSITARLSAEENIALLDTCIQLEMRDIESTRYLDEWIESGGGGDDVAQSIIRDIKHILQKKILIEEGALPISAGQILKQLLLRVNNLRWLGRRETMDVMKAVELLTEAQQYMQDLGEDELIPVLGNTGVGKSTFVTHCLGKDFREIERFGEKALVLAQDSDEEEDDLTNLPKIGQSIGTSETAFARGFRIPDYIRDAVAGQLQLTTAMPRMQLVDLPGTNDTRGETYRIATMVSVGLTFRRAQRIRAITVVVPYAFVTLDRSMPFLQLLRQIRSMVPCAFSMQTERASAEDEDAPLPVVLLITKFDPQVEAQFSDRLRQLRQENQEILERQQRERYSDEDIRDTNDRVLLWTQLSQWYRKGNVIFFNPFDKRNITKILAKFVQSPGIDQINNIFEDNRLYVNLANKVNVAADMSKELLESFHVSLPDILARTIRQQANLAERREGFLEDLQELDAADAQAREEQQQLSELMESITDNPSTLDSPSDAGIPLPPPPVPTAPTRLAPEIEAMQNRMTAALWAERNRAIAATEERRRQVTRHDEAIIDVESHIRNVEARIRTVDRDINLLIHGLDGTGKQVVTLHTDRPQGEMHLRNWKDGQAAAAIEDVRATTDSDFVEGSERTVQARDYRDKLLQHAYIAKEFSIISSDEAERQVFLSLRQTIDEHFIARFEGQAYRLLRANARNDKEICYQYNLMFDRAPDVMPYLVIKHEIKLTVKNASDISNREQQRRLLQEQLRNLQMELQSLVIEKRTWLEDIARNENTIMELEQTIAETRVEALRDIIRSFQQQLNTVIERHRREREDILRQLADLEENVAQLLIEKSKLVEKRAHYALLVHEQLTMFRSIDNLCSFLLDQREIGEMATEVQNSIPTGLFANCEEFRRYMRTVIDAELCRECRVAIEEYLATLPAP